MVGAENQPSRREIEQQANTIGQYLTAEAQKIAETTHFGGKIDIRSPCEGHLWTPAVAQLLMGPRSNGLLMQLYNEYLHQMVLLRDSLLPFENFADVHFHLQKSTRGPGLRKFESARAQILVECLTRSISQKTLLEVAKTFIAPDLPEGGYGFQGDNVTVLPAFLFGSSSPRLLRYHSAAIDASRRRTLFVYEHEDYYTAPRTDITQTKPDEPPLPLLNDAQDVQASLALEDSHRPHTAILKLRLDIPGSTCISVDVGQVARGLRFSTSLHAESQYATTSNGASNGNGNGVSAQHPAGVNLYSAPTFLSLSGLISAPDADRATYAIRAVHPLIQLALLGKIYPHNVFVATGDDSEGIARAQSAPAKFGGRWVILGGVDGNVGVGEAFEELVGGKGGKL
jgi:hypothetical protein